MRFIVCNRIKTPDGTILSTGHKHDGMSHTDAVSGEEYLLEGAYDYNPSQNVTPAVDVSVYHNDDHELVRDNFQCIDNLGCPDIKTVLLKDLSPSKLALAVSQLTRKPRWLTDIYTAEYHYRATAGFMSGVNSGE